MDLLPEIDLSWWLVSPKQKGFCHAGQASQLCSETLEGASLLIWMPPFVSSKGPYILCPTICSLGCGLPLPVRDRELEIVGGGDGGSGPNTWSWLLVYSPCRNAAPRQAQNEAKGLQNKDLTLCTLEYGKCTSSEIRDSMRLSSEKLNFLIEAMGIYWLI